MGYSSSVQWIHLKIWNHNGLDHTIWCKAKTSMSVYVLPRSNLRQRWDASTSTIHINIYAGACKCKQGNQATTQTPRTNAGASNGLIYEYESAERRWYALAATRNCPPRMELVMIRDDLTLTNTELLVLDIDNGPSVPIPASSHRTT